MLLNFLNYRPAFNTETPHKQLNPLQTFTPHESNIHFNIIPSTTKHSRPFLFLPTKFCMNF